MLSIYVPVYNSAEFLPRCLDSLSELPGHRVQLIFVDDASRDKSYEILKQFVDRRENSVLVRHEKNRGQAASSNTGIDRAEGEYLQRCDSDDVVIAKGILSAIEVAERGGADLVIQPYIEIKKDGKEVIRQREKPSPGESYLQCYWKHWHPCLWATMVRTELARRHQIRFPDFLPLSPDGLWLAEIAGIVRPDKLAYTEECSYTYYRRTGSLSKPSRDQLRRNVELKLMRLGLMQQLGRQFVHRGLLEDRWMRQGLVDHACGSLLRALRKSGQYGRSTAEYHRLRATLGTSAEMRREFFKSVPLGIWRLFFP